METQLRAGGAGAGHDDVSTDRTELMVYVDDDQKATLTWRVTILTACPLGQWRTFVNARRPAVVHARQLPPTRSAGAPSPPRTAPACRAAW